MHAQFIISSGRKKLHVTMCSNSFQHSIPTVILHLHMELIGPRLRVSFPPAQLKNCGPKTTCQATFNPKAQPLDDRLRISSPLNTPPTLVRSTEHFIAPCAIPPSIPKLPKVGSELERLGKSSKSQSPRKRDGALFHQIAPPRSHRDGVCHGDWNSIGRGRFF